MIEFARQKLRSKWATLTGLAILFHLPRVFLILDATSRSTGNANIIQTYPTLCKWDCFGYHYLAVGNDLMVETHRAAFLPGYAALIGALHFVFPHVSLNALSVLSSNFFSILAVMLIILLGQSYWGGSEQPKSITEWDRAALLAGFFAAIYPNSQVSSYGYPEPLFLALFAGQLICLLKERWLMAALLSGLAAVVRPQGIWLLGLCFPALLYGMSMRKKKWSEISLCLGVALVPFLGLLVFEKISYGNVFEFFISQRRWGRELKILPALRLHVPAYDMVQVILYTGLIAGYRFLRRSGIVNWTLGIMSIAMMEIPLFMGGILSYARFSSLNLAVFLMLAEIGRKYFWFAIAVTTFLLLRLHLDTLEWAFMKYFAF